MAIYQNGLFVVTKVIVSLRQLIIERKVPKILSKKGKLSHKMVYTTESKVARAFFLAGYARPLPKMVVPETPLFCVFSCFQEDTTIYLLFYPQLKTTTGCCLDSARETNTTNMCMKQK